MTQSDFKFELARSEDMSAIGELTSASSRSLTLMLNKAGALDFTIPLVDDLAYEIKEVSTCVCLSYLGDEVWSGPVWTVDDDTDGPGGSVRVGCVGWLQTLDKRVVRPTWNNGQAVTYTGVDAGEIAFDLVRRTNEDAVAAGAPSFIVPGTAQATIPRTRTYQPWTGILTAVEELTTIESGFDMFVHPFTRELHIVQQIQESKGVHYELGRNVKRATRRTETGRTVNWLSAYSSVGYEAANDPDSIADTTLFEEAVSLSDVVDRGILLAYAAGEVALKKRPLPMLDFQPHTMDPSNPQDYLPFRDFNPGDLVHLTARKGRLQLDKQLIRLFGYTLGFNPNGSISMTGIQSTLA